MSLFEMLGVEETPAEPTPTIPPLWPTQMKCDGCGTKALLYATRGSVDTALCLKCTREVVECLTRGGHWVHPRYMGI